MSYAKKDGPQDKLNALYENIDILSKIFLGIIETILVLYLHKYLGETFVYNGTIFHLIFAYAIIGFVIYIPIKFRKKIVTNFFPQMHEYYMENN